MDHLFERRVLEQELDYRISQAIRVLDRDVMRGLLHELQEVEAKGRISKSFFDKGTRSLQSAILTAERQDLFDIPKVRERWSRPAPVQPRREPTKVNQGKDSWTIFFNGLFNYLIWVGVFVGILYLLMYLFEQQ